jgi:hypothetical protein
MTEASCCSAKSVIESMEAEESGSRAAWRICPRSSASNCSAASRILSGARDGVGAVGGFKGGMATVLIR